MTALLVHTLLLDKFIFRTKTDYLHPHGLAPTVIGTTLVSLVHRSLGVSHQHNPFHCPGPHITSSIASPHLVGAIHAIGNTAGAPQALRKGRRQWVTGAGIRLLTLLRLRLTVEAPQLLGRDPSCQLSGSQCRPRIFASAFRVPFRLRPRCHGRSICSAHSKLSAACTCAA